MNRRKRKYLIVLIIIFFSIQAKSQKIGAKIDFFGYIDNREFKATYTPPKTLFGTILSPQVYFELDNYNKLVTGIHYNQDFGNNIDNKNKLNAIAYYNYDKNGIDFGIGLIPRYEKLKDIPRLVLADTLMYDRPNIEGLYLEYNKNNKKQLLYIDWLNKQSHRYREQFVIGTTGLYKWGKLYFSNDGLLYHNSLSSNDSLGEHIQDNLVFTTNLGMDLSKNTFLDSLTIDIGAVFGFDRLRTVYEDKGIGFISNLHLSYKSFFLKNTIYLGHALNLPNGDPFYKRKYYDRIDLGWKPFNTKHIEGRLTASFHFRKGGMDNQQAFTLRYKFGQQLWSKKK